MGFHELIEKVQQAETALEARERQAAADWRQTKATWRSMWTPGRIVIAGLASGFIVGQARPARRLGTGQDRATIEPRVLAIFDTCMELLSEARRDGLTTVGAARRRARAIIAEPC